MKKRHAITIIIIVIVAIIGTTTKSLIADPTQPRYHKVPPREIPSKAQIVQGEVLVKYKESVLRPGFFSSRDKELEKAGQGLKSRQSNIVAVIASFPTIGSQRLKLSQGTSVPNIIDRLKADPAVELAEPNYKVYPLGTQSPPPNDPEWINGSLWGMVQIGMKNTWGVIHDGGLLIAVIDTGIDYQHPDLSPNIWHNPAPTFGDVHGANFCDRTAAGKPTGDPMDVDGHGTLVAGTIAALGNNNLNVVGVNWTAKLMALKFICPNSDGIYGTVADAIDAIDYAMKHNATILNNSWTTLDGYSSQLELAIRHANCELVLSTNCRPALFVAAAGNQNSNNDVTPSYPANYNVDNVMAVAATTETDGLWNSSTTLGSNWGATTVHIAAPGADILSTYLHSQFGGLSGADGTSMAAPHVSGCAALVQAARLGSGSSFLIPKDLKILVTSSADQPVDAVGNKILAGKVIGERRLNCWSAIQTLNTTPPAAPTNLIVR